MEWKPTRFVRFEKFVNSSTNATHIVTDAGPVVLKAIGNKQGPHELACEYVGTQLARWIGLSVPDFGLITLEPDDEVQISETRRAQPGPAFVSRRLRGHTWGGDKRELDRLKNKADAARLVAFDTWTRNCDRHCSSRQNVDNVFVAADEGPRLVAIDHGHCFTCGSALSTALGHIDRIREQRVYGLFDAFRPFVTKDRIQDACAALKTFGGTLAHAIVETIPTEWEVEDPARSALAEFLVQRAGFVGDHLPQWLEPLCWPGA
jgi:hypothetical protein